MNLRVQTPDDASELGALDPWRWQWLLLVVAVLCHRSSHEMGCRFRAVLRRANSGAVFLCLGAMA